MSKNVIFWIISFLITITSAYYQRVTGPSYPITGTLNFGNENIDYELHRSHGEKSNHDISIVTANKQIKGIIFWKRFKTDDDWQIVQMNNDDGKLTGSLPLQPPAGKLEYKIILIDNGNSITIPEDGGVIIRFRGAVPAFILIPHIIFMFGAMLLSTRTGLEIFNDKMKLKQYTIWTIAVLIIGGLILGPITQLYAFGALWTGFPFGHDLTDNKTLIAFLGWLIAAAAVYKSKNPKPFVIGAAIIMLIVFLIPHSLLGSELDYSKLDETDKIEQVIE
jgi:hypothetical protein